MQNDTQMHISLLTGQTPIACFSLGSNVFWLVARHPHFMTVVTREAADALCCGFKAGQGLGLLVLVVSCISCSSPSSGQEHVIISKPSHAVFSMPSHAVFQESRVGRSVCSMSSLPPHLTLCHVIPLSKVQM